MAQNGTAWHSSSRPFLQWPRAKKLHSLVCNECRNQPGRPKCHWIGTTAPPEHAKPVQPASVPQKHVSEFLKTRTHSVYNRIMFITCYHNLSNVVSWLVWWVVFVDFFLKLFRPREIDWVGRFCGKKCVFFQFVFYFSFIFRLLYVFNLLFNLFHVFLLFFFIFLIHRFSFLFNISQFFMGNIDPK